MRAKPLEAVGLKQAEHKPENPRVGGSIPPLGTTILIASFFRAPTHG